MYKRKFENGCINKPFICELCNICYSTPRSLINHLKRTENLNLSEYSALYPTIIKLINNYYKKFLENRYIINQKTGCWNWQGKLDRDGYGFFNTSLVHRYFYKIYKGEIPKKYLVCHKCNNPQCVNPKHLYTGTNQDNMNDMIKSRHSLKGKLNPAKRKDVRKKISKNNSMLKKEHRDKISKKFEGRKYPRYNYYIISPKSKKYQTNNLFKFCQDMKLEYRRLLELSSGQRKQYKNWSIKREKLK